jgi:hypothetical protein
MLIAFEGPDNTGKSTAAAALTSFEQPIYNATNLNHKLAVARLAGQEELVQTFDRIDWFTHMVYRLALPDREWNDERPRTVFAMPDTHLVIRLHHPELANFTAEEVVDTPIARVNPMYYYMAVHFMNLNRVWDYAHFKSITIVEVRNEEGSYQESVVDHDSPAFDWGTSATALVKDAPSLLDFLRYVDQHIG